MRQTGVTVVVIAAAGVLGLAAWGGAKEWPDRGLSTTADSARQRCSEAMLRGSYGIQIQGTRPSSPGGPTETVVGLAMRRYDGKGTFTQVGNLKGSISGWVPDVESFGTYEVSSNCTGVAFLEPAPGVVIQERIVITDRGNVLYSASMAPPPVMVNAVQRRVHTHE
jgi:hypothetical protein